MTHRRAIRLSSVVLFAGYLLLTGCNKSTAAGSTTVTPNIVNSAVVRRAAKFPLFIRDWMPVRVPGVAQTTATSIESLQYFIQSIQLCEDIEIHGTGYSGTTNCITLYEGDTDFQEEGIYNTYTVTEAIADTDEDHYIDFMSAEGRARLAVPIDITPGTYRYGLINFMRPIKIQATFDSPTRRVSYYTKAPTGGEIVDGGEDEGGREIEFIRPSNTTVADAELMTYMLNNGGTWFPFLKPFVIEEGDEVVLDFVFNPESFATAMETGGCAEDNASAVMDLGSCVTMDLPYAKMAPVPRQTGEATMKEIYLVDYTTGASESKVRLELYFNSADPDLSIQGVDSAIVMQAGATERASNVIQAYQASEADNIVTFLGYNSETEAVDAQTMTGLDRRNDGTVTVGCYFVGGPCMVDDGSTVDLAYTFVGTEEL